MNNLYGAVMSKTTVDGRKGCKKSSDELFERRCIQATDVACVNNKGNKKKGQGNVNKNGTWAIQKKQKRKVNPLFTKHDSTVTIR